MALDLSDDYLAVDLEEPITLVSRATAAGSHSEERHVSHAFRRGLTTKEQQASAGAYVRMDTAFDVPMKLVTGYNWKPGDTLTDQEENEFVIYTATKDPTVAFWSLVVYDPKIAYDLRHEMDIYNLEYDKDAAGAGVLVAQDLVYDGISCRLQWTSGQPTIENNRSGVMHEATIYSSQRLYMKENYLIEIMDNVQKTLWRFDVVEWVNPDRIDELMAIRVRAKP